MHSARCSHVCFLRFDVVLRLIIINNQRYKERKESERARKERQKKRKGKKKGKRREKEERERAGTMLLTRCWHSELIRNYLARDREE